jgi:triacylglycerol lipase
MGDRTTNFVLSAFLPNGNDGKVSIASARLDGMKDFLVIPVSHTFIMRNAEVIRQTLRFLEDGSFDRGAGRG